MGAANGEYSALHGTIGAIPVKNIVVVGAGFAGLWSAIGAARKLDELGVGADQVRITVVNRDSWHGIRVRNYEADLGAVRVPLAEVLDPIGVERVEGEAGAIDLIEKRVAVATAGGPVVLPYDGLVLAAGSQLHRPDIPGLRRHAFSVDTYGEAALLDAHIKKLDTAGPEPGARTVLIVGGGLTGIETACEMAARLAAAGVGDGRVILADSNRHIGSTMGAEARSVIERALTELGIECRTGIEVAAVDGDGVTLAGGARVEARTVVWTAGMRANPMTGQLPVARDRLGRVEVDEFLRLEGVDGVFVAGDMARAKVDGQHASVMSCQHGRPMGRFAGHNVVCDLLGQQPLALDIGYYVTCVDLGPWGAVLTQGWERKVVAEGAAAKEIKRTINRQRIYPPRAGNRREILDAAAPVIQAPPRPTD